MQKFPEHFGFMVGTGGTPDYLEVSHRGKIKLGVKPLIHMVQFDPKSVVTFIGMRVRVVHTETAAAVQGVVPLYPEDLYKTAYPFLKLDKDNDVRGSTVVRGIVSEYFMQKERFLDALTVTEAYEKLAGWVYNDVCPDHSHLIALEELTEWLATSCNTNIRSMQKAHSADESLFHDIHLIPFIVAPFDKAMSDANQALQSEELFKGGITITKNDADE